MATALNLRELLLRWPVVALVAGQLASAWTLNLLLSWLPSYFRDVQGLSIANAGLLSAAPWLSMALAMNAGASISDRMIRNGADETLEIDHGGARVGRTKLRR